MSALTITTTLTNGHVNGQLEKGLNGYRKNGYIKQEPTNHHVSIHIPYIDIPLVKHVTINFVKLLQYS